MLYFQIYRGIAKLPLLLIRTHPGIAELPLLLIRTHPCYHYRVTSVINTTHPGITDVLPPPIAILLLPLIQPPPEAPRVPLPPVPLHPVPLPPVPLPPQSS